MKQALFLAHMTNTKRVLENDFAKGWFRVSASGELSLAFRHKRRIHIIRGFFLPGLAKMLIARPNVVR